MKKVTPIKITCTRAAARVNNPTPIKTAAVWRASPPMLRTLVDWHREARKEIRDLKDVEVEALHERVLVSYELELQRLTAQLNRIEAVLAQRNLECLSTESLFMLAATVRAQLRRMSAARLLEAGGPVASPAPVNAPQTSLEGPESGGAA